MVTIWELLTILSIILSVGAILFTYYGWKNPIDTNIKSRRTIKETDDIFYKIGVNHKGWLVEKIDTSVVLENKPFKYIANKNNNPSLKEAPKTLEDVKKLNFKEY